MYEIPVVFFHRILDEKGERNPGNCRKSMKNGS